MLADDEWRTDVRETFKDLSELPWEIHDRAEKVEKAISEGGGS